MVGSGLQRLAAAALIAAAPVLAGSRPAAGQSAFAQLGGCRLALAFALDVSASVDPGEYRLQFDGLAAALADPAVRAAILGPGGPIAFAAYEWSGRQQQGEIAGWTLVDGAAALDLFAQQVAAHKRGFREYPTAMGYALGHGAVLLGHAPPCRRRVLDVSGDGVNNEGFGPDAAYRSFDFAGVTVNGLVIGAADRALVAFYRTEVAHGPGAFVEVAEDHADYARAMRRKLLREIGADFLTRRGP